MGSMPEDRGEAYFTARPEKYPQGFFRDKPCGVCGEDFSPTGPSHKYCSDRCRTRSHADRYYKRNYGVGVDWVDSTLQAQGYTCAICRKGGFKMREDHYTGLNLDHCHESGKPRGLLCHNCNRGLGLFQDDPEILKEAVRYVEEHKDP